MGAGASSSYKISELSVQQLSLRLLDVQSVLNNQMLELNTANALIRKLENEQAIHGKKRCRLACLRYIRQHNCTNTDEGKRFFLTFALHTLTQTVRFPEFCEAQIQIYPAPIKISVATPKFTESAWPIELPILCPNVAGTKSIGRITLRYNISNLNPNEDPWTDGEERFLSEVCSLIALKLSNCEKKQLIETNSTQRLLLNNILPPSVVDTILETGEVPSPRKYRCTILFTDVVGFTDLCSRANPLCIVKMLDDMYSAFDDIVVKGGDDLYKMETIGDSYMVVSGLPILSVCHATIIVQLALDFIEAMSTIQIELRDGTTVPIKIRLGINSGEVAASIVGNINPRYCLIGDTVNTASRMESTSESMKIHISKATHECIKLTRCRPIVNQLMKKVRFIPQNNVQVKGKGIMDTFWVERN